MSRDAAKACFAEPERFNHPAIWASWLDRSWNNCSKTHGFARGCYVANTYIKHLGGQCSMDAASKAPLFTREVARQSIELKMSSIYGVPRNVSVMKCPLEVHGNCSKNELARELALQVLRAHDLVLISEWLDQPGYRMWIDWHLRINGNKLLMPYSQNMAPSLPKPAPPNAVLARMRVENALDTEIFVLAKVDAAYRVRQWLRNSSHAHLENRTLFGFLLNL